MEAPDSLRCLPCQQGLYCPDIATFIMADSKDPADDELSIPRAALNKMIKELIPNVRVSTDSRELILNCCTEFIHLLSSEANEICNRQSKKTISAEHILAGQCSHGHNAHFNSSPCLHMGPCPRLANRRVNYTVHACFSQQCDHSNTGVCFPHRDTTGVKRILPLYRW